MSLVGKILCCVGLFFAILAATILTLVVPSFENVFEAFGSQLPPATAMLLKYYLAIWLLPVLTLSAWMFLPNPRGRILATCLIGILGPILIVPICFFALYQPIFALSSAL